MNKIIIIFIFLILSFWSHSQTIINFSLNPILGREEKVYFTSSIINFSQNFNISSFVIGNTIVSNIICDFEKPVLNFVNDYTLISSTSGESYFWYKNESLIENKNGRELIVSESGRYFVAVKYNQQCIISSDNVYVTILGKKEAYDQVFAPNPVRNQLFIYLKEGNITNLVIYSLDGKKIFEKDSIQNGQEIDFNRYPVGIYILECYINNIKKYFKIIKIN